MKLCRAAALALVTISLLVLLPSTLNATAIAVLKLDNVTAVAVDSRKSYSGDKPPESECKIRTCGDDLYVTEDGWMEYPEFDKYPEFDFLKLIDQACKMKGSVKEKADWLEHEALKIALRLYQETKAAGAIPANFRAIFFGYDEKGSFFAKRGFYSSQDGTPVPEAFDCFETCGVGDEPALLFSGHKNVMEQRYKSVDLSHPAEAVETLVKAQISGDKTGEVGPPVSVLEVTSKGPSWQSRGLCEETDNKHGGFAPAFSKDQLKLHP